LKIYSLAHPCFVSWICSRPFRPSCLQGQRDCHTTTVGHAPILCAIFNWY